LSVTRAILSLVESVDINRSCTIGTPTKSTCVDSLKTIRPKFLRFYLNRAWKKSLPFIIECDILAGGLLRPINEFNQGNSIHLVFRQA